MSSCEKRLRAMFLAVGIVLLLSNQLAAQELADSSSLQPPVLASLQTQVLQNGDVRQALSRPTLAPRPSVLVPLYVSFGALQVLDLHSTSRALGAGGREANPVVGTAVGSPVAMTALKIGATTGIVLLSEKLWKRNRLAAVVMMVTLNSGYALVASHNYSLAR
jgi:hypothetical protein